MMTKMIVLNVTFFLYPKISPYDYTKHQMKISKLCAIVSVLKQ